MMGYVISQLSDNYKFRLFGIEYENKTDFNFWLGFHNNYIINIEDQKNV